MISLISRFTVIVFILLFAIGCSKETVSERVYIAGTMLDHNITYIASYWEDGVQSFLTDGTCSSDGQYSLFVDGSDVYITGSTTQNENGVFGNFWMNGNPIKIGDGSSFDNIKLNSIFAIRGDVYVAGKTTSMSDYMSIATYWKNQVPVYLNNDQTLAEATSIFVQGSDIYVAGNETIVENGIQRQYATYWKNGQAFHVSRERTEATSIYVKGTDVYMSGNIWGVYPPVDENIQYNIPVYWKNGEEIQLTTGKYYAFARSIFVYNNDVYVAGTMTGVDIPNLVAGYWKNKTPVYLTDGRTNANANSIFVTNQSVYVAGDVEKDGIRKVAIYWDNNIPHYLSDESTVSSAQSIFVK
jgi:hypothetical protein